MNISSIELAGRRVADRQRSDLQQSIHRIRDKSSINRERNQGAATQSRNIAGSQRADQYAYLGVPGGGYKVGA